MTNSSSMSSEIRVTSEIAVSSEAKEDGGRYTESVKPLNGQQETAWCLLALVVILVIGGIGVLLNQAPTPETAKHLSLDSSEKALLTQLSSAASDIRFMAETDHQWPDIEALKAYGIPPFAQGLTFSQEPSAEEHSVAYRWLNPAVGCYIGQGGHSNTSHNSPLHNNGPLNFMLLLPQDFSLPAKLYSFSGTLMADPCHQDELWQLQLSGF